MPASAGAKDISPRGARPTGGIRTRILVILALLALALAGTSAAAPPAPVAIELTDCDYMESLNTVPGQLVDPLVPADFTVLGAPNLVIGMATCDADTSDGRHDRVTFGWADVSVQPRAGLRAPGITLYLYRLEHVATDDLYGAIHRELGAECRVMDSALVTVALPVAHATTSDDGASAWDMLSPAGLPATGAVGHTLYREIGPAVGGYAYLDGTLVNPGVPSTAGTFTFDEGSALRGLLGPAWPSRMQAAPGFAIEGTTLGMIPWAGAPAPRETC
ncbi:MAG TPA: hypothetical protein VM370_13550 [Candidatus Thermoplasmatota archaeon]|nr:hypothetical protein [Candidatus Thermoplasmatota archaeon]